MIATPETDAKASDIIGFFSCATVPADFARKLERERNEAREALSGRTVSCAACNHAAIERDEARELADRYRAAFCSLKEDSAPMPFPWEGGTSPTANPPEKE